MEKVEEVLEVFFNLSIASLSTIWYDAILVNL